jgi:elongation factor P
MLDFSDLKLGKVINYQGAPCVILKCEFMKCQMAKPTKKCILRNLINGNSLNYTFKSGESIEEADIKRGRANYMYDAGDILSFMTVDTFETLDIPKEMLGGKEGYLTEGLAVEVIYYNENPISIEIPLKVTLTVTNTVDAAKGNTVSDVSKDADVETGIVVKVPAFIKIGDKVIFNTVEDEYVGRE